MTESDITEERLEQRRAGADAAILQLSRAGGNIKLTAQAVRREEQDSIAMHATDAVINLVEMCDLYGIPIMSNVFKRLEQIDRIDGAPEAPRGIL